MSFFFFFLVRGHATRLCSAQSKEEEEESFLCVHSNKCGQKRTTMRRLIHAGKKRSAVRSILSATVP